MSMATREVSVCSWLRKRLNREYPVVIAYDVENQPQDYGFTLGDNGYFNKFVGTHHKMGSKFNVPDGDWFHVCWVWSYFTGYTKVYLNGKWLGSQRTNERELTSEGVMRLGGREGKASNTFGGDMYKLNVFSSALIPSVIRTMASDMCSEEEKVTANRIIKWEEIISKERSGWIIEVPTGADCAPDIEVQPDILERVRLLEEKDNEVEEILNEYDQRLTAIENALSHTLGDVMNAILLRLANIEEVLEDTEDAPSTES